MLKDSDNNIAEHLFKLAGASRHHRGTFASGAAAVRDYLTSLDVPEIERHFVDGSGLSRDNRISAAALTTVLTHVYGGAARDLFVRSLPIAGIDGSLKNRMGEEPVCGRVRAKTGFINRVSALSGYVRTASGESLAFAILMNNFQASNSTMKELQDDICRVLVRYTPRERTNPGG
jgi:D-alanyl-D-alanine carboxypeptidase/D-alanyl-D-alanine-endopeptidase (penicillin-binding protein 4)